MEGWIKLHRELLDKPIWVLSSPEQRCILIALLLMANHEGKEWEWMGKKFTCRPGQMITSLDKISQAAGKGISIQNVRTALSRFEKYEFLTNESTKQNRLITICNWDRYQSLEIEANKGGNSQLTNNQQTTNNQLTTNKNDKECKNEKNSSVGKKSTRFAPPTIEEVKSYCLERKNKVDASRFVDFYESKGWKVGNSSMKDWKASVRTWEKRESKSVSHPAANYQTLKLAKDERW